MAASAHKQAPSWLIVYALLTGVVPATVQLMVILVGQPKDAIPAGSIRIPLIFLLYGVIAASILWGVFRKSPSEVSERKGMLAHDGAGATIIGVFVVTMGMFAVLLLGHYLDRQEKRPVVQRTDQVAGLVLGDDYIYRPVEMNGESLTSGLKVKVGFGRGVGESRRSAGGPVGDSGGNESFRNDNDIDDDSISERPLRWELRAASLEAGKVWAYPGPAAAGQ